MKKTLLVSLAALTATSLLFRWPGRAPEVAGAAPGAADAASVPAASPQVAAQAPAFVPNRGQWSHDARFAAQLGAVGMFLDSGGWTLTLEEPIPAADDGADGAEPPETGPQPTEVRGVAVRMSFAGAAHARLVPERLRPGVHHYLLGDDPAGWRTDVPRYASVRYEGVRPGVDVRMREHAGHFEYDLLLAPDAHLDDVAIDVRGIERLYVAADGALVLETALGPVRMPLPVSWEEATDGTTRAIDCHYVVLGPGRFGFEAPAREPDWALVIDPGLVWGTYFGGSGNDALTQMEIGPTGDITIAGGSQSNDLPATPGAYQTSRTGRQNCFVARLTADGSSLLWCTYVGGRAAERAVGLALDAAGACTITGATSSPDYPTTPGCYQPNLAGSSDIFVTRLAADGRSLIWSTLIGGSQDDASVAVVVDAQGAATVGCRVGSTDFPTTSGTLYGGAGGDTLVCQVDATGANLNWSTAIAGSVRDSALGLALGPQGATVAFNGNTWSTNFPATAGAFQASYQGGRSDHFVASLDTATGQVLAATFLGGSGEDGVAYGNVAVDPQGNVIVAGDTASANFPTTAGAYDTTLNGGIDGFVTCLDPTLSTVLWSTYLGGSGHDRLLVLGIGPQGAVTVGGWVESVDYPITPGAYHSPTGNMGLTQLAANGSALRYSTVIGGVGSWTRMFDLAVDAQRQYLVTVAGETNGADMPTTQGTLQPTANAGFEGFILRLDLSPPGPPTLTGIAPNPVPIYPSTTISLTGTNLHAVHSITVSGMATASIQPVSDTQVDFTLPAGVVIADNQTVTVTSISGTANIALDVAGAHPAVLEAAPVQVRSIVAYDQRIHGDRAWTSVLFVTPDLGPLVVPGVVSLGIGNGNANALIVAGAAAHDNAGEGVVQITWPGTLPSGFLVYMQAVTWDPIAPALPLEASNVVQVTLL